ncbi:MAG: hypothetical protein ABJN69_12970 [Hellea sp.]
MQFLKSTFIIIGVTLLLLLSIDLLITSRYAAQDGKTKDLTCDTTLTLYDYCPDTRHIRIMDTKDRIVPFVNYINKNRRSTYKSAKSKPKVSEEGSVYLIGDSFIQADEMPIKDRFEHHLRTKGYDVQAYGYSSWNSLQFQKIVDSLDLKPSDNIYIFSMTNDFTPDFSRSTLKTEWEEKSNETNPSVKIGKLATYKKYSFLKLRYDGLKKSRRRKQGSVTNKQTVISHDSSNYDDCASLPAPEQTASKLAHNYLELSKDDACWSQHVKDSVDLNVRILSETVSLANAKGATVKILLVPAGWAYKNQNTIGRQHKIYQFPQSITVTQSGLTNYLKDNGLPITDLYEILQPYNKSPNTLHYAVDGHWTEKSHDIIGDFLEADLKD